MPESVRFLLATYAVQLAGCLLMAVVVYRLYRVYRRDYLRLIGRSWLALAVYFVAAPVALATAMAGFESAHPVRLGSSMVSLVAGYWQVAWLLAGTSEVAYGSFVSRRRERALLAVLAAAAIGACLLYVGDPDAATERLFVRFGLKSLITGTAFLACGIAVRIGSRERSLGSGMVVVAFVSYGTLQLAYACLATWQLVTGEFSAVSPYLTFVDFFLLVMIGLGTVVWLLEIERDRLLHATQTIDYLANYDPLTGLPNRDRLLERARLDLEQAGASGTAAAMVVLDVDGFDPLCDSLGRAGGEKLLRALTQRMKVLLGPSAVLARVGDDALAAMVPAVGSDLAARRLVEGMLDEVRKPVRIREREVYLTASAGVAVFPRDGTEVSELLANAEAALHGAQERGRDGYLVYSAAMSSLTADRLDFESSLRRALANHDFVLEYQPIVALETAEVVGFEALLRWRHLRRGLLHPGEFLGVADGSGLLPRIEWRVFETACRQAAEWNAGRARGILIAVNLSPGGLEHPATIDRILGSVTASGLDPGQLQVEITEAVAAPHADSILGGLEELRGRGVRVAIDDFGTGHSSLSRLRSFPVDVLKMDRSFVRGLDADPRDAAIAGAVIDLAHGLGLKVVAEGVETEGQRSRLLASGCDLGQGFLFGTPMSAEACRRLLAGEPQRDRVAEGDR